MSKGKKFIFIIEAIAVILLSITSAIAVSNEYPIALVDSINIGAYGDNSKSFTSISPTCYYSSLCIG